MVTAQTKAHDTKPTPRPTPMRKPSCAQVAVDPTVAGPSAAAILPQGKNAGSEPRATVISQNLEPQTPNTEQRKCLATGELKPKDELIRFVLDPDNNVVPDLAAKLGGRGLWVSANREALQTAIKKNLFSRAAKTNAKVAPGLLDRVETLLAKRCLNLLGLAKSAGALVIGQPQVEEALKAKKLAYILLASGAGKDIKKKLSHLCHPHESGDPAARVCGPHEEKTAESEALCGAQDSYARGRSQLDSRFRGNDTYIIFSAFTRTQLGEALGREHLVAIGLMPHKLTEHLYLDLTRWRGVMSDIKTRPDSEQT